MERFYVYILYSKLLNKTYVGCCSDLAKRVKRHLLHSANTTKKSKDFKIVWYCRFFSKKYAYIFERFLKSSSGRRFMRRRLLGELSSSSFA